MSTCKMLVIYFKVVICPHLLTDVKKFEKKSHDKWQYIIKINWCLLFKTEEFKKSILIMDSKYI